MTVPLPEDNDGRLSLNGGYIQSDGAAQLAQGSHLSVTGAFEEDGGTVTDNGTITVNGNVAENGGLITLNAGTITASEGVDVVTGAVLSGDGTVNGNVTNVGEVDGGAANPPGAAARVSAADQTAEAVLLCLAPRTLAHWRKPLNILTCQRLTLRHDAAPDGAMAQRSGAQACRPLPDRAREYLAGLKEKQ
jgi:hypothetical protein